MASRCAARPVKKGLRGGAFQTLECDGGVLDGAGEPLDRSQWEVQPGGADHAVDGTPEHPAETATRGCDRFLRDGAGASAARTSGHGA